MSLSIASLRNNPLLRRTSTARLAPRPTTSNNRTVTMSAAPKDGAKLDKSTPDSVWKTILNAEEVWWLARSTRTLACTHAMSGFMFILSPAPRPSSAPSSK